MGTASQEELVDAVYRAALEPASWSEVVSLMGQRFPSLGQAFYFLHLEPHRVQPVCLAGIEPRWTRSFDASYFAPDNPWIRLSKLLHRPGVVRTNERLDRVLKQRGALYRSAYYNDWMRPQGFKYTIGNTLLADRGVVANLTLLRPADMATFSASEVRGFEAVSRHMTRALQMAIRLQCLESSPAGMAALDTLPSAIAVIDARRHLQYANPAMEAMLSRQRGLTVQHGELRATHAAVQQRLAAHVAAALSRTDGAAPGAPPLLLANREEGVDAGPLMLNAMPLSGSMSRFLPWRPMVLVLVTECLPTAPSTAISRQYGCTAAESRLAELLAAGHGLRASAQLMGITYGTARGYLKIVFDKTGVRTQAQLVARLLGGSAPARTGAH